MAMYAAMAWSMCVEGVEAELEDAKRYTNNIKKNLYQNSQMDDNSIKIIMNYLDSYKDYQESKSKK